MLLPQDSRVGSGTTFATGTLQAKATKGGTVVATDTVKTAGAAAQLALVPDRATIAADGRDLGGVRFREAAFAEPQRIL